MNTIMTLNEIQELIIPIIQKFPVKKFIIYGSYARGDATADSDIDFLVDSNDALLGWGLCSLLGEIAEAIPKPFHCYERSMVAGSGALYDNIIKDGVILYER